MRAIRILKLLIQAFQQQSVQRQVLFILLIAILLIWICLFFSAYVIWFSVQLIFKEVFLRGLVWYLVRFKVVSEEDLSKEDTPLPSENSPP